MQILFALNAPLAAVLGYFLFDEYFTSQMIFGGLVMFIGGFLAILYTGVSKTKDMFEAMDGRISVVVFWGLVAAICQAIGLLVIKPALVDGNGPYSGICD